MELYVLMVFLCYDADVECKRLYVSAPISLARCEEIQKERPIEQPSNKRKFKVAECIKIEPGTRTTG